jgi:putative Mg2+ transporter-C (MgtC) family protein
MHPGALAAAAPSLTEVASTFRLVTLFRLVLAAVLGGAIGMEREVAGKPAGLRTNMLICVGAAMFMQLSIAVAEIGFSADGHPYGDTTRIAAQIVSGIGFLGAGAIIYSQGTVIGLTTAATIWVVAAVGAAVGAGAYVDAVGSTVLIVAILVGLRPIEHRLLAKRRRVHATLRVKPGVGFETFAPLIEAKGVHVFARRTFEHDTDRTFELELIGANSQLDALSDVLRERGDVVSITTD